MLFLGQLFAKTFTDALLIGNLTEAEAKQVVSTFQTALGSQPFPRAEQTPVSVIELPESDGPFFLQSKTQAQGNAALLGLEGDRFSPQDRNVQQILGQVIREAFYAELRTKQQTGYLIFSSAEEMEKHLFTFFAVQSNSHGPDELLYRFEQFLEEYLQNLARSEITSERFELLKGWLRNELKEAPQNLSYMGEKLYLLAFKVKDFDWIKKRLEALENLSYDKFIESAEQFLERSNKRRLAVLINGQIPKENQFYYKPLP